MRHHTLYRLIISKMLLLKSSHCCLVLVFLGIKQGRKAPPRFLCILLFSFCIFTVIDSFFFGDKVVIDFLVLYQKQQTKSTANEDCLETGEGEATA